MIKPLVVFLLPCFMCMGATYVDPPIKLANSHLRLSWQNSQSGWFLDKVELLMKGKWQTVDKPSGEYTLLYSAEKPDSIPNEHFKTVTNENFPDPVYKYQVNTWNQSILP